MNADPTPPYRLSFTAASLKLEETVQLAQYVLEQGRPNYASDPILSKGKKKTWKRLQQELGKRIDTLTPQQLDLLVDGDLPTRRHMAFLGVCKAYAFIREFTVEVLREKYLVFDTTLHEGDYQSFFQRKEALHEELARLTESSRRKIRSVTLRILTQASLLESARNRNIQHPFLHPEAEAAIRAEDVEWLKIFLFSDQEMMPPQS